MVRLGGEGEEEMREIPEKVRVLGLCSLDNKSLRVDVHDDDDRDTQMG